ncbi:MAG: NAD-dependent epimerase/dehydratase family protein, partial [Nitrososphaerales archaeon]
ILSTGEGWRSSDNLYGFAKLMGELQLKVMYEEKGFKSSICRYLTVYGPGQFDASHAIAALIERALDKEDPYVVWGSGCLPPDGWVLTDGRYKQISNLNIGDVIMDSRGTLQPLFKTFQKPYHGKICIIKPAGLPEIKLTPEHMVLVAKPRTSDHTRSLYHYSSDYALGCPIQRRHRYSSSGPVAKIYWKPAGLLRPTTESGEYLVLPKLKIQDEQVAINLSKPTSKRDHDIYRDLILDKNLAFFVGWYTT